ncbi:hypothetical protein [Pseudomonas alkylphenolica]|uniref:hypothetical protein n=1 Tax=Pseudomonas alkylphenolica TaxID=237609 RepID=UPI000B334C17|nr:hypothetical protein [Pseudomonas alkylphenolica]
MLREDLSDEELHVLWTAKPWEADDQEGSAYYEFEDGDLDEADGHTGRHRAFPGDDYLKWREEPDA